MARNKKIAFIEASRANVNGKFLKNNATKEHAIYKI